MSIYFGHAISPNNYWNGEQLDMLGLNQDISNELKTLTTHINSISDYELTLNNLEKLNVDFTLPFKVNECLNNNFEYTGKKKKESSVIYLTLIFLIKLFYFAPYLVWKKIAFPKINEKEFMGTFRYALMITLAPLHLIIVSILLGTLLGKSIGLAVAAIGIILPLITLRIR